MSTIRTTTRLGFLGAACAMTLALLLGVASMSTPNTAEAWIAKAPAASTQS